MSYLAALGDQSTSSEILTLTNLNELGVSSSTQFIQKTGDNTFENVEVGSISSSYLRLDQTDPQTTVGTFTFPKVIGTTDITTPLLIGGTAVGSKLTYKSTTGVGTTTGIAHQWLGGTDGATVIATMLNNGNVGIGTTSPTAYLHIKAGTATAGTAPLKFTSGTLNTTEESGTIEYDGTDFYISI
jgi:hypothetical protein